jgi:hypothetical protein
MRLSMRWGNPLDIILTPGQTSDLEGADYSVGYEGRPLVANEAFADRQVIACARKVVRDPV